MARRNDEDWDDDGEFGDDDTPDGGPQTPQEFAALRRQKREAKTEKERADKAERTLAFVRAGIDPDEEGIGSYFVKGYDGDLDPVKIREAAIAAKILEPPAPNPEEQAAADKQAAALASQQRIAGAATAATAAPTASEADRVALQEAMKAGGIDAMAQVLASQGIPLAEN